MSILTVSALLGAPFTVPSAMAKAGGSTSSSRTLRPSS